MRYWAVQRECQNNALLQMIQTAIKMLDAIHLNPDSKTLNDDIGNLHAFSREGQKGQKFKSLPQPSLILLDATIARVFRVAENQQRRVIQS